MTNKVKPRRTSGTRPRPEMDSEDPAAHVFVDIETEGQADLLGNPLATPRAIATLHFNNRVNQPTVACAEPRTYRNYAEELARQWVAASVASSV